MTHSATRSRMTSGQPGPVEVARDVPGAAPRSDRTGSTFWRYLAGKVVTALISFLFTLVIGFVLFS